MISLEYLMKREGYEVIIARDGQEAMDAIRRERPQLVLLDVMMPKKTGFEVCQEVRADEALKDTLILMLTAKGRDTDVAKGLGVGADAYMTKPFSTRELVPRWPRCWAPRLEEDRPAAGGGAAGAGLVAGTVRPGRRRHALGHAGRAAARGAGRGAGIARHAAGDGGPGFVGAVRMGAECAVSTPCRGTGKAAGAGARAAGQRVQHEIAPAGGAALQGLADAFNRLVRQRSELRDEMAQKVAEASRHIEQERNRLAALMSELTQSVVVCNLDGRILLYNNRARLQFRALSDAPTLAGGAELIGLGRSIYAVFDRKLVAHALENIQQRLQRGAAQPTAQFVTTTQAGQLLRARWRRCAAAATRATPPSSTASC